MALIAPNPPELLGVAEPRVAPILPASSRHAEYRAIASEAGIELLPWQTIGSRYLNATDHDRWYFPEVCIVVARQNGKTEMLVPRILLDLRDGKKIIHTAQNRTLPRQVFLRVARALDYEETVNIRYANGQEKIEMRNGGTYTIVAPQRGARGLSADTLIFDEIREFEDFDIIAAASPTLTASHNPQTIYLSNAGSDVSVVLNDLKRRAEDADPQLAYLEWSAAPERSPDDQAGWAEANPSLGHFPFMRTALEQAYASKPLPVFETEHLCRWVVSMQPRLVSDAAWLACRSPLEDPSRPSMAFNMDPSGKRASAIMAWQMTDGRIACDEVVEAFGDPIDVKALGTDLLDLSRRHAARRTAFASWTDKDIARYLPKAEALDGKEYANASEHFARLILQGRIAWDNAPHLTDDIRFTARKPHESGAWQAVPASADHSITAVGAAIRAVWLASAPKPPAPRIG